MKRGRQHTDREAKIFSSLASKNSNQSEEKLKKQCEYYEKSAQSDTFNLQWKCSSNYKAVIYDSIGSCETDKGCHDMNWNFVGPTHESPKWIPDVIIPQIYWIKKKCINFKENIFISLARNCESQPISTPKNAVFCWINCDQFSVPAELSRNHVSFFWTIKYLHKNLQKLSQCFWKSEFFRTKIEQIFITNRN